MRSLWKILAVLTALLAFVTAVIALITEGLKFYRELPTPTSVAAEGSPAANQSQVPNLYDDFNNPTYDGTFDSTRWIRKTGCENSTQSQGIMVFKDTCDLITSNPSSVTIEQLEMFEARMKVASDHNGDVATQEIDFITYDLPGGEWWALCGIRASEEVQGFFMVVNQGLGEDYQINKAIPAEYDRWYTLRIEVDSNTMTFSCYMDNQLLGSVVPKEASLLREARFERVLEASRFPEAFATTYADDIRIKP
jgi:hypothetical protein